MLLLKAYAKHHSGYHRLLMGKTKDVLKDFTGCPVDTLNLKHFQGKTGSAKLWSKLTKSIQNGNLMCSKFKLEKPTGNKDYNSSILDLIEVNQTMQNGEIKQMKFVLVETPTFYVSEIRDEYCTKLTKYDADIRQLIQSADHMTTHQDSQNSDLGENPGKISIRSFSNVSIKNCGKYENMVWIPYE
jgi:hypothetical protein